MPTLRRRVYELVEFVPHEGSIHARMDWFDLSMMGLILVNVVAVIMETLPGISPSLQRSLVALETGSIIAFTLEYILRLWACRENPRYADALWGRLRLAVSPMLIIDLVAILPFYLQLIWPGSTDLRFILALRFLRVLRVLKFGRYSSALALIGRVLRSKAEELTVMLMVLMVVLVVSAGLVYYAESGEPNSDFKSIPHSLWWAVITLTTIGYGDMYPRTELGKFLGGIIAVCGIGFVAMPTAIVSAGFAQELARSKRKKKRRMKVCPHCGRRLKAESRHSVPVDNGPEMPK